jgi:lysophospholipase L1-like esterase
MMYLRCASTFAALLGVLVGCLSETRYKSDTLENAPGNGSPAGGGSTTDEAASGATNGELEQTCNLPGVAGPETPTIWVVGDSTASVYASDVYPRMGWAQPMQDYIAPACASARDMARSGRSSKSFFDEGLWTPVRDGLKIGDFVLIQFGHNDEKDDDPTRFTEPFTTFEQFLSTYVDDTLAKGATPVLLTPIHRNEWSGLQIRDTHGNYSVAVRQLAEARQVALIDASALTQTLFEALGPAATTALFMDLPAGEFPNYPDGNSDQTHLREAGARAVLELILADSARQGLEFGRLVKMAVVSPIMAATPQ